MARVSSEKIKPCDTNLESTMFNLANAWVILKFKNSVLVQKSSSSLYSNFILSLYIVSKLSDVGKNEVVKKTVYDEFGKKINVMQATDGSNLV